MIEVAIDWLKWSECPEDLRKIRSAVYAGVPRAGDRVEVGHFVAVVDDVTWCADGRVTLRLWGAREVVRGVQVT